MALLGSESWDLYDTANINDYWQLAGANASIVPAVGRCGTAAYHFNSAAGSGPSIGVSTSVDGGYTGFGWQDTIPYDVEMLDVQDSGGGIQFFLMSTPSGSIEVWRGPNTVLGVKLGNTASGLLTASRWYHIGCEWVCNAVGSVKIWINGVLQLSLVGVNTRTAFGTSNPWAMLTFMGTAGYLDDVYWGDSSGSAPQNAFLGDLRVEGQVALTDLASGGGGTFKELTPSTGTDHGALVDETPPDDDTTYNEGGTVGLRDTYKFPNITLASGTVYGIQLMPNVKKTLSGGRTIANIVYQGAVLTVGSDKGISQTDYTYQAQMFQVNPTTATAWTAVTADNMEGGIKITT